MAEGSFERKPPYSLEAERAVLGACLMDRDALNLVTEMLSAEDFYDLSNRTAYELILDMSQKDVAVDPLTLLEEMSRSGKGDRLGGQPFVASLVDQVSSTANAEFYARIVKDKGIHRRLIAAGTSITRLGYSEDMDVEEILEEAERAVFEIAMHRNRTNFRSIADVLGQAFHTIEEQYHRSDQDVLGLPSGFAEFDRMTGGFQPGSLNIIAARPSMGKTALAINMAQYCGVSRGAPVLIFSLEMGAEQLVQRMLGAEARINIHELRTGAFAESAWDDLANAAGRLSSAPIYIDDSSMLSTLEFRARCRRFQSRYKNVGLVVVDYLQLMSYARKIDNKQQEVAEISRALKGVARELNVPIIALSQLSRAVEQRTDKKPQLSDLRDSGAIEQDADIVVLLYRPGYYDSPGQDDEENPLAYLNIAKHRNGPTGEVQLVFLREYTKFENPARSY